MTNDLIETVARAICDGMGSRSWDDVPADRGDLRYRVRSGKEYDVNEPTRMDYMNAAQDAIRAAAPLILDMAAERADQRREAQLKERNHALARDHKSRSRDHESMASEALLIGTVIRSLKEKFQ